MSSPATPEPDARSLVHRALERLGGAEGRLAEVAFRHFFSGHPEIEELFGRESISEQQEMVRETLASVLAHVDAEPWLAGNLEAMGASHAEYGVRGEMYDRWAESMLLALADELGDWDEARERAWHIVLLAVCAPMRAAGEPDRSDGGR